tara:strand:+ start:373 stop:549 length:177 start_codon:yes stop_codon:yes gene_type:complete
VLTFEAKIMVSRDEHLVLVWQIPEPTTEFLQRCQGTRSQAIACMNNDIARRNRWHFAV